MICLACLDIIEDALWIAVLCIWHQSKLDASQDQPFNVITFTGRKSIAIRL